MKQYVTRFFSFFKKKLLPLSGRLAVAIVALALGGVMILWDLGIVNLPFLTRPHRQDPVIPGTSGETVTLEGEIDWDRAAKSAADGLYNRSFIENGTSILTAASFQKGSISLVKTRLPEKTYSSSMGFVVSQDGTIRFADSLNPIPGSEAFTLTTYRDQGGNPIFQKKESGVYYVLDPSLAFIPAEFDPETDHRGTTLAMPASWGAAVEDKQIVKEGNLFGYTGKYLDGRRKKTFTTPVSFTRAYNYSEGFAVATDEKGKVVILNDRGEAVFTSLSLILPDVGGKESLGFTYFQNGLLRVVFATYDENGNVTEKREGVINTAGGEFHFPKGYRAVSYHEGIFVVTNGEKYGYYSYQGAWIADPVYADAQPFFEGIAVVKNAEGKCGLIDTRGDVILPLVFDSIENFSGGVSVLNSQATGSLLLSKVMGVWPPENAAPPSSSSLYTKITITRGPQNTYDHEDDIIIEVPASVSTTARRPVPGR